MANFKYFSDFNGELIELTGIHSIDNTEFAQRFAGIKGIRYDGFSKTVGRAVSDAARILPVTRRIEYKAYPSRHECNAKCLNGKATGTCECKCGGRNHGRGAFTSLIPTD
jgi:hypothetical protein